MTSCQPCSLTTAAMASKATRLGSNASVERVRAVTTAYRERILRRESESGVDCLQRVALRLEYGRAERRMTRWSIHDVVFLCATALQRATGQRSLQAGNGPCDCVSGVARCGAVQRSSSRAKGVAQCFGRPAGTDAASVLPQRVLRGGGVCQQPKSASIRNIAGAGCLGSSSKRRTDAGEGSAPAAQANLPRTRAH